MSEQYKCDVCGEAFDNVKSKAAHMGHGHDEPWMDEGVLREEYVENGRSSYDLAEEWGCDSKTVRNWLDRHGIERRHAGNYHRKAKVYYDTSKQGYGRWQLHAGEDRGSMVVVHRLAAVAWFGLDAVSGNQVHHKNGVKWDNREENLELMTASEHAKMHYENGDLKLEHGGIEELQGEL